MTSTSINSPVEADPLAEALRSLRRGLSRASGFALFVGVVKTPAQSHRIIKLLAETMPGTPFQTFTVMPDTTDILAGIQQQLGDTIAGPVMIVGLENALSSDVPNPPILHALNLRRPDWPTLVPQPVVLWVTEFWLGELARSAPDFLDWRSDTLHFPDLEPGQLEILDAATWEGGADTKMPVAARMERIKELESLIATNEHNQDAFIRSTVAGWLNELGLHLVLLGKRREALECFQKIQSIAKQTDDKSAKIAALGNISNFYLQAGDLVQAATLKQRVLKISRKIGDKNSEAITLPGMAAIYLELGDKKKAIQLCEEALIIAREIGNRHVESITLGILGIANRKLGNLPQAIDFYQQATVLHRAIGDIKGEADCYSNLGVAYNSLGDFQKAIEFCQQSLDLYRQIGARIGEAHVLANLGVAYVNIGTFGKAMQLFEESLNIYSQSDDQRGEGTVLFHLAVALHNSGKQSQAIARAKQALNKLDMPGDVTAAQIRSALAEWQKMPGSYNHFPATSASCTGL